jgi:hypothetical protein
MEKTSILNLFYILHFGRSADINICVKLLLSCVHGGFLWLDRPVSIDMELIVCITGLSSKGEDPLPFFTEKSKEKAYSKKMKDKYDTFIVARGLDLARINNDKV